ncbi:MAG: 2-phospho-L-lactate transferase [Burkholderiales bacterium]
MRTRVVALCGGVGGAKLAYGLSRSLPPEELSIIVNTGDDFEHLGLHISPDIDTVTYTLADAADEAQGWGRADEQWTVMQEIERLGGENWFQLGDRDVALHLLRTQLLRAGNTLTVATAKLAARFGVGHAILPMSNEPVRTVVETDEGELAFQDYFVRRRCEPKTRALRYVGADDARLSPEVTRALDEDNLRGVIVCPSNPYLSIAPILAVADLRVRLRALSAPVLAVSPIVAGLALKGPATKMMSELGAEGGALGVARIYSDFIDALLIDARDAALARECVDADPRLLVGNIVMASRYSRVELARTCLAHLDQLRK